MEVDLGPNLLIFYFSRSKVGVKKLEKLSFSAISFDGRSVWVTLEADGVRPGTIGTLPIFIDRVPKATEKHSAITKCHQNASKTMVTFHDR